MRPTTASRPGPFEAIPGVTVSRWWFAVGIVLCLLATVALALPANAQGAPMIEVYRFFNMKNGVHFYTASVVERDATIQNLAAIYKYEGVAYVLYPGSPQNSQPLWRFYNKKKGFHFYTASNAERDSVIQNLSATYQFEGEAYKVSPTKVVVVHAESVVWRFYNKKTGSHFYTHDGIEKDNVIKTLSKTYRYEGPAFWIQFMPY